MKRMMLVGLLFAFTMPAHATHTDYFAVPCSVLWPAIKETAGNLDYYHPLNVNDVDMAITYEVRGKGNGWITDNRNITVWLFPQGDHCKMVSISSHTGVINWDTAPFKRRVDESLERLKAEPPAIH